MDGEIARTLPRPADRRVTVVGAANSDIVGAPTGVLLAHDSNPGHVRTSAGGVGRNIAENLARLGACVRLVTAFGDDAASDELMSACVGAGLDVAASLRVSGMPGARYLAIVDETGDLAVAVNDMRVLDRLDPDVMRARARAAALRDADLVVLDANLPADTILWVTEHTDAPIVLDPVSVAKAPRAAPVLSRLAAIKASALEAGAILGRPVDGLADARAAAEGLVARGVASAFVTCGPAGSAWADAGGSGTMPSPSVHVANTNGAGDAFCAGAAFALLGGAGTRDAALFGGAVAALTLEDERTVSPGVTIDAAMARVEERG